MLDDRAGKINGRYGRPKTVGCADKQYRRHVKQYPIKLGALLIARHQDPLPWLQDAVGCDMIISAHFIRVYTELASESLDAESADYHLNRLECW